jgi:hypothetical protein
MPNIHSMNTHLCPSCEDLRCMACAFHEIHGTCVADCPACCTLDSPIEGYVPLTSIPVCPFCALEVADAWLASEHVCLA